MAENKLAKSGNAALNFGYSYYSNYGDKRKVSPWTNIVDKLDFQNHDTFENVVKDCRFFYRYEPIAKTIIDKMVDLAINDLVIIPDKYNNVTERSVYDALKKDILKFVRQVALEYLLTGLVVPEITLTRLNRPQLQERGIKRLDSLMYPTDMWLRDSSTIKINKSFISNKESYFVEIPEDTLFFILNEGQYKDGGVDKDTYNSIVSMYPDFVRKIREGETEILLDNPIVIKSNTITDSQYPIPYMFSALEVMKHKRNLRKVDYSIAARIISAILHVTAGDKDFPVTEDQQSILDDLESKFKWRENLSGDEIERVFTLFTNHTVNIKWIFPDVDILLNDSKYTATNMDIMLAFGFPRILITGETERSFTSDPNIATLSPIQTLEAMRQDLLPIIMKIFNEMVNNNDQLKTLPEIKWKPISLISLQLFYQGIKELYDSGNISRETYASSYGFDFKTEVLKRVEEQKLIEDTGLPEFAPAQFSSDPRSGGQPKPTGTQPKPQNTKTT